MKFRLFVVLCLIIYSSAAQAFYYDPSPPINAGDFSQVSTPANTLWLNVDNDSVAFSVTGHEDEDSYYTGGNPPCEPRGDHIDNVYWSAWQGGMEVTGTLVDITPLIGSSTTWTPDEVVEGIVVKGVVKDKTDSGYDDSDHPSHSSSTYGAYKVGCAYSVSSDGAGTNGTVWQDASSQASVQKTLSWAETHLVVGDGEETDSFVRYNGCEWTLVTNPSYVNLAGRSISCPISLSQSGSGYANALQEVSDSYGITVSPSVSVNLATGAISIGFSPSVVVSDEEFEGVAWIANAMEADHWADVAGNNAAVESTTGGTWSNGSVSANSGNHTLYGPAGTDSQVQCKTEGKIMARDTRSYFYLGEAHARYGSTLMSTYVTGIPHLSN